MGEYDAIATGHDRGSIGTLRRRFLRMDPAQRGTVAHRAGTRKRYRAYRRRNRGPGQAGSEGAASSRTGAAGASVALAVASWETIVAPVHHHGAHRVARPSEAESWPEEQTCERIAGHPRESGAAIRSQVCSSG